jgi:hypothetical protein
VIAFSKNFSGLAVHHTRRAKGHYMVNFGGLPTSISIGDRRFGLALHGLRFNTYAVYLTASPPKMHGQSAIKNHAPGHIEHCSMHSFSFAVRCWIVSFSSLAMPVRSQKISIFAYSPPRRFVALGFGNQCVFQNGRRSLKISLQLRLSSSRERCGNNCCDGQQN